MHLSRKRPRLDISNAGNHWSQLTGLTAYTGTQLYHTLTLLSADVGKFLCRHLFTASTSVEPCCVLKSARFMWISSIFQKLSHHSFCRFIFCPRKCYTIFYIALVLSQELSHLLYVTLVLFQKLSHIYVTFVSPPQTVPPFFMLPWFCPTNCPTVFMWPWFCS